MKREVLEAYVRNIAVFDGIPVDDLDSLLEDVFIRELATSEVLIVEGDEAQSAYLILDGEVEISRSAGDGDVIVATRQAGELVGEMALLMEARRNATVRAKRAVTVMEISADKFRSVLASRPTTAISMLRTLWSRLQTAEALLVQHQKMAALGTLAAGMAHELNNPAAAMVRSVQQLGDIIANWEQCANALGQLDLSTAEQDAIEEIRQSIHGATVPLDLDPLALADLEDALQAWLQEHSVDDPWQLAPQMADSSVTINRLDQIADMIREEHLPIIVRWYGLGMLVLRLLDELSLSGRAISEIVTAIKGYTRLDQAPIQEINIHEGIDQALIILRHKLRGIRVDRQYAEDLPRITAFAGELNQLWTNLIDNAADAMDDGGTLTVRTYRRNGDVYAEIEDTGPGIPQADQECIFDPFFTTKPPGEGTGLGLAISFNIVRKHSGDIRLDSAPGRTRFSIRLPIESLIG